MQCVLVLNVARDEGVRIALGLTFLGCSRSCGWGCPSSWPRGHTWLWQLYGPDIWAGRQWFPPRNYWPALLAGFPGLPAAAGSSANGGKSLDTEFITGACLEDLPVSKGIFLYVYFWFCVSVLYSSSKEWPLSSCCRYHQITISEHLETVLSYLLWLAPWVSSSPLAFLLTCVHSLKLLPSNLRYQPFMNTYFLLFSFPKYHPYLWACSLGL